MEKRKDFVTLFGDLKITHIQTPLHEEFRGQAPTGATVIGRIRHLRNTQTESNAFNQVATELSDIWTFGLNIYPQTRKNIVKKLGKVYKDGFVRLLNYAKAKKNDKWVERVKLMCEMLQTGFDIKTKDDIRIKLLEDKHSVKITPDETKLYEDNCKTKSCSCSWYSQSKCQECPRQMYSSHTVDKSWQKWKERNIRDLQSVENQRKKQSEQMKSVGVKVSLETLL